MEHYINFDLFEPKGCLKQAVTDSGVFDNLLHDDLSLDNLWTWLDDTLKIQISIDNEFIGFVSIEDFGNHNKYKVAEIHAYIIPKHRRHSIGALKTVAAWIFNGTGFNSIVTSTSTRDPRIDRVVKMIGFKQFDERKGNHTVGGVPYDMHYFYLNKEQ